MRYVTWLLYYSIILYSIKTIKINYKLWKLLLAIVYLPIMCGNQMVYFALKCKSWNICKEHFVKKTFVKKSKYVKLFQELDTWQEYDVDAYIIIYSITDRRSYQKASDVIFSIRDSTTGNDEAINCEVVGWNESCPCTKPIVLVANKTDLERSRMIGKEGDKYSLYF